MPRNAASGAPSTRSTSTRRQDASDALRDLLPGRKVVAVGRAGKLVLIQLRPRLVLGLHFGMTGRLIVDGDAAIERLEYGARRDDPAWDRFTLRFAGRRGGGLRVNDPRRWATFTLDPDVGRLGPDFLAATAHDLASALAGRRSAVKAVLLDQTAVAGYGNMCVDEVLWQAGIAPGRRACDLSADDVTRLADCAAVHLPAMLARGGSHTGTISPPCRAALPAVPAGRLTAAPQHRRGPHDRVVPCPPTLTRRRFRCIGNGHTGGSVAKQEHPRTTSTTAAGAVVAVVAVGDPDGTRAVTSIVALLVVIGFVLLMTAVWLFRSTRPDPEVLAPLEIMGDRTWRRADPVWQRRRLDEVRPDGAEPLLPSVAPPDLDEAFDLGPTASGFDDLHDREHETPPDDVVPGDPLIASAPQLQSPPPPQPSLPVDPTTPIVRDGPLRVESRPPSLDSTNRAPAPSVPPAPPAPPAPMDPLIARARSLDGASTPTGIARPIPEDLPDHDVDPALLAAALAELDAELGRLRRPTAGPSGEAPAREPGLIRRAAQRIAAHRAGAVPRSDGDARHRCDDRSLP